MEELSKQTLEKLNIVLQCDPSRCQKSNCPLYYEEYGKCDVDRFLDMFNTLIRAKFKDDDLYFPGDYIN